MSDEVVSGPLLQHSTANNFWRDGLTLVTLGF